LASHFMLSQLEGLGIAPARVTRFWLHQANVNLNDAIVRPMLGEEPDPVKQPIVIDRYGNTASAGSIIAFDQHHDDLPAGALGLLCSFGAGYSIGSVVLRRT